MNQPPATSTASPSRLGGWDLAGVALSGTCLVHCTVLPLALAALPFLGISLDSHEELHHLLTALVVPVALSALIPGFLRHRRAWVLALGFFGLAMIAGAPLFHEALGELGEQTTGAAGALALVAAHLNNRPARAARCGAAGCC